MPLGTVQIHGVVEVKTRTVNPADVDVAGEQVAVTEIVNEFVVAVAVFVSVTRIVSADVPPVVGVPEIVLPDNESPAGNVPDATENVFPPLPPLALKLKEYEVPERALSPEEGVVIVNAGEIVTVAVSDVVEAVEVETVFVTTTLYPPASLVEVEATV